MSAHPIPNPQPHCVLVTFLGTGNYAVTQYQLADHIFPSRFACTALARWLQPSKTIVLLTADAAANSNAQNCAAELREIGTAIERVAIPDLVDQTQIWQLFDLLAEALPPPPTPVYLDVTHGFRSLPLIATLAASFLRASRQLRLEGVFYGAYRPGAPTTSILDLTPLLELMDWAEAASLLERAFDGRRIAELTSTRHRLLRRNSAAPTDQAPRHLGNLGQHLQGAALAYRLGRAREFIDHARDLSARLDPALPEAGQWLRPLPRLFEKIRSTYPTFPNDPLAAEHQLIRLYRDHGQTVQAVGLAREWIVSWAGRHAGWETHTAEQRHIVERALHQLAGSTSHVPDNDDERHRRDHLQNALPPLPQEESVASLWETLTARRNDLQHFGFNNHPAKATDLERAANKLVDRVLNLPLPNSPTPVR
jgi:CRISPR-associated DxTHG motif protein